MDHETLKNMGGMIHNIRVPYSAKTWGDGQSRGGDWAIDLSVGAEADPEAVALAAYDYLKALAHRAMKDDLAEGLASQKNILDEVEEVPFGGEFGGEGEFDAPDDITSRGAIHVPKFEMTAQPDGRYQLKLWADTGQYPEIWYTASKSEMSDMVRGVWDARWKAPVTSNVDWIATWEQGRPKKNGKGHYKDLVELRRA